MLSLAAAVLLVAGGAAAQYESANTDTAPSSHARLRIEPTEIWLRPGEPLHTKLGAQADVAQVLSVKLIGATPPLKAALSADTINVSPGRWDDHVDAYFAAADNASRQDEKLTIAVASSTGETQSVGLLVHVLGAEHATTPTATAKPTQTWMMGFSPSRIEARPGQTVTATLYAKAYTNRTIALSVRDGANASLASATIDAGPATPASDALRVAVPADAKGDLVVIVEGADAAGERHDARLLVHVAAPPTPRPTPPVAPSTDAALMRAIEAYLQAHGLADRKVVILVVDGQGRVEPLAPEGSS
ncbi:MAG: hypothetical protein QOE90_82 [Thermoplasmata archaeon]|nr:hypothetical protein [Thermoplasmata archaeon]